MRSLATQHYSLDKIFASEARKYNLMSPSSFSWFATPPATTITAGAAQSIASATVPAGRCLVVNEIRVNVTGKCCVYLTVSHVNTPKPGEDGPTTSFADAGTVLELSELQKDTAGGSVVFRFDAPLWLHEFAVIQAYYVRDTTTAIGGQLCVSGIDITNDLNFSARHKVAVIGDSIPWSSGGQYTSGRSYWPSLLVQALRGEGKDVRLIMKAFGGSTSIKGAAMTKAGYLDFDFDLLFISYGMNDSATGGPTQADYKAALRVIIDYARQRNRGCSVVVCGAPSTDDANRSGIANYRTYAAEVAAEYAERVHYVDLSTSYASSSTTDFTDSGPKIHPNKAGHGKLFDVVWPVVQTTHFYQNS
jgi:lysophospholipase L1-like esterase